MTPDELAKLQRDYLIRTEKQSAVLIANEFENLKTDIQRFLIENATREASIKNLYADSFLERFLLFIDNQLDVLSIPLSRIVARGQRRVINLTSRILADYLSLDASIFSPDKEAIKILIGRTQSGETLQKFFLRMKPEIAAKVKQSLIEGFSRGESVGQIAKRITDVSDVSRYRAMTAVRTEQNESYRAASRIYYSEAGIKKYIWKSVLDHRTCLICWALHNRVFETGRRVFSHPNCRCTLVAYQGERLVTGDESFGKLESGFQKQILGEKRFQLFKKEVSLESFVGTKEDEIYGLKHFIKPLSNFED